MHFVRWENTGRGVSRKGWADGKISGPVFLGSRHCATVGSFRQRGKSSRERGLIVLRWNKNKRCAAKERERERSSISPGFKPCNFRLTVSAEPRVAFQIVDEVPWQSDRSPLPTRSCSRLPTYSLGIILIDTRDAVQNMCMHKRVNYDRAERDRDRLAIDDEYRVFIPKRQWLTRLLSW